MAMLRRLPRPVVAGVFALAIAGCSGGSSVSQGVAGAPGLQGGSGNVINLASHHFKVGDVSGTTLSGDRLDLASYRGKVVVVNFWGSWCAPCIAEADGFSQVAKDFADKGVAFVGIDVRELSEAQGRQFERVHHVPYPSIYDQSQTLALRFPHAVPATTPTTIVIGGNGDILAKVTGGIDYTHLKALVTDAVDGTLA
ncbi:MAG TPA: TlpA disulfide reductase family protein [Mycobacteriales bacterium]|nr:TlpA disulfide reductase family protein [Mycobacteriales bacterium]